MRALSTLTTTQDPYITATTGTTWACDQPFIYNGTYWGYVT